MFLALASGCVAPFGVYHRVKKGETLSEISRAYDVPVEELQRSNRLSDPNQIQAGQELFIPWAQNQKEVAPARQEPDDAPQPRTIPTTKEKQSKREKGNRRDQPDPRGQEGRQEKKDLRDKKDDRAKIETKEHRDSRQSRREESEKDPNRALMRDPSRPPLKLIWPVEGVLTSGFGLRRGRVHQGIDIAAPAGTPIVASADGEVIFAGNQRNGYGNMVIIQHKGDYYTVYAHNQVNLVKTGDKVKQGQLIGKVGRTGRATGTHVHFEVRYKKEALNPLLFLPKEE